MVDDLIFFGKMEDDLNSKENGSWPKFQFQFQFVLLIEDDVHGSFNGKPPLTSPAFPELGTAQPQPLFRFLYIY